MNPMNYFDILKKNNNNLTCQQNWCAQEEAGLYIQTDTTFCFPFQTDLGIVFR